MAVLETPRLPPHLPVKPLAPTSYSRTSSRMPAMNTPTPSRHQLTPATTYRPPTASKLLTDPLATTIAIFFPSSESRNASMLFWVSWQP